MTRLLFLLLLLPVSTLVLALEVELHGVGTVIDGVHHVNAVEASALLDQYPSVRILDVRTGFEFKGAHLKDAVNINYYSRQFKKKVDKLDKTVTWLVHCRTGSRSGKSLPILKSLGFQSLMHLDGGIKAWSKGGHSISKD